VLAEADRGIDIGQILGVADRLSFRELKSARNIMRKAMQTEIDVLAGKDERERRAFALCQDKVKEYGLAMDITGAEFQFDGKKLTFYYTATKYVDFRDLVRGLFRIFGTRIWMVWCDGGAPVRDIFTRGLEK
jgi:cell fate regulator YaaT (PSP1 superfamily)